MIKNISLQNFRSYEAHQLKLSPSVTVISGPNGSGKTNILEALHVVCRGSSFRANDMEMLQFDKPWWRIDITDEDSKRTALFDSTKTTGRKQFVINGVKKYRLSPLQKVPVVLFEPNDLRLLQGSPTRRRAFIDTFISQLEPSYSAYVSRYDRSLRQRNNLLKSDHVTPDELFVWDMSLSQTGAYVIAKRFLYADLLNEHLTQTYQSISKNTDTISVSYATFIDNADIQALQQRFLAELHRHHKKDIVLGYTSVGPHRDDLEFTMNSSPATAIASRGETRSIVLSLKLIEIEHVLKTQEHPPLLLLDDVFSELDATRRAALTKVSSDVQTVITTNDYQKEVFENALVVST